MENTKTIENTEKNENNIEFISNHMEKKESNEEENNNEFLKETEEINYNNECLLKEHSEENKFIENKDDEILKTEENFEGNNKINTEIVKYDGKIFLEQFFSFLDEKTELDFTACGYFCKVANNLLMKKTEELLNFMDEEKIYDKLIHHIYHQSISEFFLKILITENSNINYSVS